MSGAPTLEAGGAYAGLDLSGMAWTERDLAEAAFADCTVLDAHRGREAGGRRSARR